VSVGNLIYRPAVPCLYEYQLKIFFGETKRAEDVMIFENKKSPILT